MTMCNVHSQTEIGFLRVPVYLVIMRAHYFVELLIAGGSQLYWERLFIVLLKLKFMFSFCFLLFVSVCMI